MAKATKKASEPTEEKASKTSYMIKDSTAHKVKYISLMESVSQSKIVEDALAKAVTEWERKNGQIPVKK